MGPDIYTRNEILSDTQLKKMYSDALQQRVLYEDDQVAIQLATTITDATLEDIPEFCFNGSFGLVMTHKGSNERLAVSGFYIRDRNGQHELLVEHLAQGSVGLPRTVRREFMQMTEFRDLLLERIIQTASEYDISSIEIVSALNHYKVKSDQLPFDRACQIIDDVALRNGFEYIPNGNLYREVKTT